MRKALRLVDTPVLLVFLGVLAFGIQAVWLGYTLDDWVFLYHNYRGGYDQLAEYSFGVNRPFGAWPWGIGFALLGYAPFQWQLWSLAWRVLTAILLWMAWKRIFPEKKLELSLACALFLVYPVFVQQTAAVTFSDHWMCFALYALSILLMVISIQKQRLYYPLTTLALFSSASNLFTIEYYVGLEFIRPLLLWFLLREIPFNKSRFRQVFLHELPYAILLAIFLIWRFLLMPTPGFDRNRLSLLSDFVNHPFQTAGAFLLNATRDLVEIIAGAWYKTYDPRTITAAPLANLISWGVVVAVFLITLIFFFQSSKQEAQPVVDRKTPYQWVVLSFVVMIAGFLPAWVTGQQLVSGGNYSDRFGLAAMFGASLLVVSLVDLLLKQNHKRILICLLISLAAGYHFRLANEFRWNWERQSRLAWQLSWRIPGLQPGTSIYGDGTLANGSWVDIAWINFLYETPSDHPAEDYWYYDLNKFDADHPPQQGQALAEKRFELLSYQGNTSDSLVVQFKSTPNQCLWVVTNEDAGNPYLNPTVKAALPLSDVTRINTAAGTNRHMTTVFLPEPLHEWCYYFEKAQLAIQNQQWEEVKSLWQSASEEGLKTGVAVEYLPFIQGVAKAGDLESALIISTRAKSIDIQMHDPICQVWKNVFETPSIIGEPAPAKQDVIEQLECEYLIQ